MHLNVFVYIMRKGQVAGMTACAGLRLPYPLEVLTLQVASSSPQLQESLDHLDEIPQLRVKSNIKVIGQYSAQPTHSTQHAPPSLRVEL